MTPQLAFSRMPPGFRFQPTDEQLVVDYLQRRTAAQPCVTPDITDIDVYNVDPWQLPAMAMYGSDHDRYFFTMAAREAQARRTTPSGFWKPTGTKKTIFVVAGGHEVPTAVKRRFVFYLGHHQPSGSNNNNKTSWIMHEYRLMNSPRAAVPSSSSVNRLPTDDLTEEMVLCRISNKDLPKPPFIHNGLLQFSSVGLNGDGYNYLILDHLEPPAMEYPNVDIGNVDDAAAADDDPGDLDEEIDDSMQRNHGG